MRRNLIAIALVTGLAAMGPALTSSAEAGSAPAAAASTTCATVRVTATPKVNAQNAPYETVTSKVTSCSGTTETVSVVQTTTGFGRRTWTVTLAPGQTSTRVRHIGYVCCGTYRVTDRVRTSAGVLLARSSATWTFA